MDSKYLKRRDFLKNTAAGATALVASGAGIKNVFGAHTEWTNGMQINPAIDNLRVVACKDSTMVKSVPTNWNFDNQNNAVDTVKIQANLDAMVMSLANKTTPAEAWKTIFRSSKAWAQTKAAIKVCCLGTQNMPRLAIVDKVCRALNALGVPYTNMSIYDGTSGASAYNTTTSRAKLPTGVVVSTQGTSGSAPVSGFSNRPCWPDIANGTIDILVNIGTNRGHGSEYGNATLCMKNHFGTFNPNHSTDYMMAINKSNAIVGGNPPRQQLCIIDSLFAAVGGPTGAPSARLDMLIMGVFGPAVDYITITKIRTAAPLSVNPNAGIVARFMTDFGYTTSQLTNYINIVPVGITPQQHFAESAGGPILNFVIIARHFKIVNVTFNLPSINGRLEIKVLDMKGRSIAQLPGKAFTGTHVSVTWDGMSDGRSVPAGNYVVRVKLGDLIKTNDVLLEPILH